MKCPNCKEDLFDGQYACHRCGCIVEMALNKAKKAEKKKTKKETK